MFWETRYETTTKSLYTNQKKETFNTENLWLNYRAQIVKDLVIEKKTLVSF